MGIELVKITVTYVDLEAYEIRLRAVWIVVFG
jgi:negative regulator of genetic competence, sporulation and motility